MFQLESFRIMDVQTKNIGYEIKKEDGRISGVMIKSISTHEINNSISTDMKFIKNSYIIGYDKDKNIVDKTSDVAVDFEIITI